MSYLVRAVNGRRTPDRQSPTRGGRSQMTRPTVLRLAGCAAVICSSMGWAASPAWASRASIRAAIVSYMPRVDVAEGHVLVALGEYKERHDPAPLEAAIADSVSVIGELRQAVA